MTKVLSHLSHGLRRLVVISSAVILVWSFLWVMTRPWRTTAARTGQTVLRVVHWGEKQEDQIVRQLIEEFESLPENRDIKVLRINPGQAANVNTKLQTMFASGEPADVFYLGAEKVADFASKGLLADIEKLMAADAGGSSDEATERRSDGGEQAVARTVVRPEGNADNRSREMKRAGSSPLRTSDFFESVLASFRYDGTQIGRGTLYGLPKDFTTVGFYYNKTLFRRAGLPEPPTSGWTWDEFIHAAREIGKLPGCHGADFVTWEAMVRIFLWTHGHDFFSADFQEFYFDRPEVVATLQKLADWFHREERTLLSAKTQLETYQEPFLAGNIGLAGPYGRWKVPIYRVITDFEWDFAPLPHAVGRPPVNGVLTVAWAIAEQTPHKAAAWRLVKFLCGERGQQLSCAPGLAIPSLKSVAYSPLFADPDKKPERDRVYLDMAEVARPIDWPANPLYMHQLRVRLEGIFKIDDPVLTALSQVQREWTKTRDNTALSSRYPPAPWRRIVVWIAGPLALLCAVAAWRWWRGRPARLELREELSGLALISPWALGFLAFCAFPIVMSLLLAFMKWSGLSTLSHAQWVGLDNLRQLFIYDGVFRHTLWITAWYVLLAVPLTQIAALGAALLLNRDFPGIGIFRGIWYLPSVLAGVGMAIMWKWVFHHEYGLLNSALRPLLAWSSPFLQPLLGLFGWHSDLAPPAWLEKDAYQWGVPVFAFIAVWGIGGTMMIYLAGLKGIPRDLYEAAAIDGAPAWRRFLNITLPMLSPVIFFNVIMAIIGSFQVFTQAYVMTGGGPSDATRFYVMYLYNQAFDIHDMGYASAMAWILLLIILALTFTLVRASRRYVYYEGLKS